MIISEEAEYPSTWRYEIELEGYLKQNRILGIKGIDTRALTRILSTEGTMKEYYGKRFNPSQIKQKWDTFLMAYQHTK